MADNVIALLTTLDYDCCWINGIDGDVEYTWADYRDFPFGDIYFDNEIYVHIASFQPITLTLLTYLEEFKVVIFDTSKPQYAKFECNPNVVTNWGKTEFQKLTFDPSSFIMTGIDIEPLEVLKCNRSCTPKMYHELVLTLLQNRLMEGVTAMGYVDEITSRKVKVKRGGYIKQAENGYELYLGNMSLPLPTEDYDLKGKFVIWKQKLELQKYELLPIDYFKWYVSWTSKKDEDYGLGPNCSVCGLASWCGSDGCPLDFC